MPYRLVVGKERTGTSLGASCLRGRAGTTTPSTCSYATSTPYAPNPKWRSGQTDTASASREATHCRQEARGPTT